MEINSVIISHKHKFIFIHVPKCAGSSIASSLANYYGCDTTEKLKTADLNDFLLFKNDKQYGNAIYSDKYLNQHTKYKDIKNIFRKSKLNIKDYFTFSFFRNPWQNRVSQYEYAKKQSKSFNSDDWSDHIANMSFCEFTKKPIENLLDWVVDENNDVAVDFLGSGRNLQKEFNKVCKGIGIPCKQLPHINATKHKHYTKYYDDETKQIVAKKYAKEIEYFGYKFGE